MKFRSARFDGGVFKIDCPHCSGEIEIAEGDLEQINTPYGADMLCPHERCNWHVGLPNAQEIADLKAGHVINTDPPTDKPPTQSPVHPKKRIKCPECKKEHHKKDKKCPFCGFDRKSKPAEAIQRSVGTWQNHTGNTKLQEPKTNYAGARKRRERGKNISAIKQKLKAIPVIIGILALFAGGAYGTYQIMRWLTSEPAKVTSSPQRPIPAEPNLFHKKPEILLKLKHPFSDSPQ